MKAVNKKIWSFVLTIVLMISVLTGCGAKEASINGPEVLQQLLTQVKYAGEMAPAGDNAKLYFPGLAAGAKIDFYAIATYAADELCLITLPDEASAKDAEKIVMNHVKEVREQFQNYLPKELGKIDKAIIYRAGKYVFLCITDDYENAKKILMGQGKPGDANHKAASGAPLSQVSANNQASGASKPAISAAASAPTGKLTAAATTAKRKMDGKIPEIKSKSGEWEDYDGAAVRVDNMAYELYTYVDETAAAYADIVNKVAAGLSGITNVYDIAIPTAMGVVFPDDVAAKYPGYDDQKVAIDSIYGKMSADVKTVNCFDNLRQHRDEYLYFRTDYHWNGRGAYYTYESFCNTKGVAPVPLSERQEKKFDGFLGELYWNNVNEDPKVGDTPDTVYAYEPKSQSATMVYTDKDGNSVEWPIINDVSDYAASMKYMTFAAGDNPLTVFENPEVTDGSVAIVVKESFGNALMPYFVDHYSKIYEIDYRYWKHDIVAFAKENNVKDLIFANNLSMIRSNYLVGELAGILGK